MSQFPGSRLDALSNSSDASTNFTVSFCLSRLPRIPIWYRSTPLCPSTYLGRSPLTLLVSTSRVLQAVRSILYAAHRCQKTGNLFSMKDRVYAMISLAHPAFRQQLQKDAKKAGLIPWDYAAILPHKHIPTISPLKKLLPGRACMFKSFQAALFYDPSDMRFRHISFLEIPRLFSR